jgi:hypothetical protein
VDHDGFDVIFDDGDLWKRFQVKTIFGKTGCWDIHRRLLRPTTDVADYFGFEASPEGIGLCGGVILQKLGITSAGALTVTYLYTDLDILQAFHLGIIRRKHKGSNKAAVALFQALKRGYETISIPQGAFLQAKGPSELLALAGFNTCECGPWIGWLRKLSARHRCASSRGLELPGTEEKTTELIRENILKLTSDEV